jgi:SM-20-related protein
MDRSDATNKASVYRQVAEGLSDVGYAVTPQFIHEDMASALRSEVQVLIETGGLHPGTIGQGRDNQRQATIRGDVIQWIDGEAASSAVETCLSQLDALRIALNRDLFLGLLDFESHLTAYPAGSRYERHLDQFRNDDRRRVSCILYLNENWVEADGGQLRLYLDSGSPHRDVLPSGGTLVSFLSSEIEHAVLPARRTRYSLTGWFRVRG